MEFILSLLEDAQQRRGKKIDGKVMKVLLRYEQHFDDDCLGKPPVVDKIERFRNECGFMKTIFEDRIYDPWPPLDRNENKLSNVERKQIILSRKERMKTIDEDSDLGKLEREARISRLWEKYNRDDEDRQTCACEDSDSDSYYETDFYYGDDVHQENEQADYEEYLNNLSSKDLEIMDARNARVWEQTMKDEDDYVEWNEWKEWCDQREEESKKNRETVLKKDNTDDDSFDTTYATESTDSTSVSVKHNTDNYELNQVILHVNKATHVLLKLSGESEEKREL